MGINAQEPPTRGWTETTWAEWRSEPSQLQRRRGMVSSTACMHWASQLSLFFLFFLFFKCSPASGLKEASDLRETTQAKLKTDQSVNIPMHTWADWRSEPSRPLRREGMMSSTALDPAPLNRTLKALPPACTKSLSLFPLPHLFLGHNKWSALDPELPYP